MDERDKARQELSAQVFKAMGHPMRLAILEKLQSRPWCVCDIADSLGLNKSIASKHLSQLYEVGLLEVERKGTQVIYTLAAPCFVEMAACGYEAVTKQRLKRQASIT